MRRKTSNYFKPIPDGPEPVSIVLRKRVQFNEVDVMGIVWYGCYMRYFEEASAELGRRCGMSYSDLHAVNLRAPIAQVHVDYHNPLILEEQFELKARAVWCEGARINIEYSLMKENGKIAATGYTVQLFIDTNKKDICLTVPRILEKCRNQWRKGAFRW